MSEPARDRAVAAVDLGSNSFHMVVAHVVDGHLHVVDRLRERVALAEGLDDHGRLSAEAQRRALGCLDRFGQRLRDMGPADVRAVGTNTFRRARNARPFLAAAEAALAHRIEVVSGSEEARLVYLGVAHSEGAGEGRRLVVDIGGGSTECIVGEGFEPLLSDSFHMGCVTWSLRFFPGGVITRRAMERAELAARLELRPVWRRYRKLGWNACVGSSGTILAVGEILRAAGEPTGGITRRGLRRLVERVVDAGGAEDLKSIPGVAEDRLPVLPGGIAILSAVFDSLRIRRMSLSDGALREGLLHDLLGRRGREDLRDRTIRRFARRCHADPAQARRVARTALGFLDVVAREWDLEDAEWRHLLEWAACVHEVGLSVSYSGYHKHGAYLVRNSDMPGLSRSDQEALAVLVLSHRRRLRRAEFEALPPDRAARVFRLCVLLRLAVRLRRGRSNRRVPPTRLSAGRNQLSVEFPAGWLDRHPLTRADLAEEAADLAASSFRLRSV